MKYRVMFFGQLEQWEVEALDRVDAIARCRRPQPGELYSVVAPGEEAVEIGRGKILAAVVSEDNARPEGMVVYRVKQGKQREQGCIDNTTEENGAMRLSGREESITAIQAAAKEIGC